MITFTRQANQLQYENSTASEILENYEAKLEEARNNGIEITDEKRQEILSNARQEILSTLKKV